MPKVTMVQHINVQITNRQRSTGPTRSSCPFLKKASVSAILERFPDRVPQFIASTANRAKNTAKRFVNSHQQLNHMLCNARQLKSDSLSLGILDVRFINTLPVLMALRHARESGNPGSEGHGDWMPAYAGMTFYGAGLTKWTSSTRQRRGQIARLCEVIAREFQPEKIILFGSWAYGTPDAESDIDLLIVMPFEGSPFRQAGTILK